jgi:mono/diheme cytochrome c family protein
MSAHKKGCVLLNATRAARAFGLIVLGSAFLTTGAIGLAQNRPGATYKAKCSVCHGRTGNAATPSGTAMKLRPFNDPAVMALPDFALVSIVRDGSGNMPAYKSELSDAQIRSVVAYIHRLQRTQY